MAANMVLLEKITVGAAGAASVTFSSIPQTGYTDLVVKFSTRSSAAVNSFDVNVGFNGLTTNFSWRVLQGSGSAASSANSTGNRLMISAGANNTASTFGSADIYIPNYTSSNYKSISADGVYENNATAAYQELGAILWSNTAAITSVELSSSNGNFVQYSTFYLYGVAKLGTTPAIVPYATGGDTIMTDGTYWYHTFISSGTFTPQKALTADYLVVAGGAGGSGGYGGGGGAGGLRSTVTATGGGGSLETALSLGTSAYTVTIGAGGAGGGSQTQGAAGSDSIFSTITSTGGGRGGIAAVPAAATTGGSGGGGSGNNNGAAGTSGQGRAGGNGYGDANDANAGGGGGANAVGGNASAAAPGNGGAGVATSISGSSVTYAGGGGGGSYGGNVTTPVGSSGGSGGGGAGGQGTFSTGTAGGAGTVNTGSGGGGAGSNNGGGSPGGGAGGSGIVIVRYAV